jgi:hypothetical protein
VELEVNEAGSESVCIYLSQDMDMWPVAVNIFMNFGSCTVHYRIYKDGPTNALSFMFLYFSQWLLHVSARQCHPQGATGFLLSYCKVQCVRRQV